MKINRKTLQKIKKAKSWFLTEFKKIYKFLARLIGKKRERTNAREISITDLTDIKMTIMKFYEQHYLNKFDNLNEMDKFL